MAEVERYGAPAGAKSYWIKEANPLIGGQYLRLIKINEFGEVRRTRRCAGFDEKALTEDEAVGLALEDAVAEADRDLRERGGDPDKPPEPPPPVNPAEERFYDDSNAVEAPPEPDSNWRRWG